MKEKICVFAGSFDPPHLGHIDVIGKCNILFEKVVVGIGKNENKTYTYPLEVRLEMLKRALKRYDNVEVTAYDGLTVDFLRNVGTTVYVRGVRNEKDYEYEKGNFDFNVSKMPEIQTYFIPCSKEVKNISSTLVKKLLTEGKSVEKLVPREITDLL